MSKFRGNFLAIVGDQRLGGEGEDWKKICKANEWHVQGRWHHRQETIDRLSLPCKEGWRWIHSILSLQ